MMTHKSLKSYLKNPASMTVFLRQQTTDYSIDVQVLFTGIIKARYVREVILSNAGKPLIYAQTSMPNMRHSVCYHLRKLGNKPLGDYLFKFQQLQRSPIILEKLNYWHPLIKKIIKSDIKIKNKQGLLARHSTFYLHKQPIKVTEVLLPDFRTLAAC